MLLVVQQNGAEVVPFARPPCRVFEFSSLRGATGQMSLAVLVVHVLSPTLYLVRVCEPVERLSIKYTQTPPPHSPLRHSADWRGSVQCRDSGAGGVSPVRVNW